MRNSRRLHFTTAPSSSRGAPEAEQGTDSATLSEIEGARPSQGYASATCPTVPAQKAPAGKITRETAGETALYLDDAMLDDVLPIIRRRLSVTRHVDLTPRVHWTTHLAILVVVFAVSAVVAALLSAAGQL